MLKKILIALLLIFLVMGAVSASEDIVSSDNQDILAVTTHTVTSDTYGNYFNSKGELVNAGVNEGDTITLSGSFSAKNFTLNKKVNLQGSSNTITGGVITLNSGASGSSVTSLNIINSGTNLKGIFINGASNCIISSNRINNTGISSYAICLNPGSNYNNITNNVLQTAGETYGHGSRSTSVIVLGGANNNYIADNTLYCADANAIYLSTYGNGGDFKGGESNYNTIYKNTITYTVNPTSWAYAVQLMGRYNTVDSNTINGAYRGVSSSNLPGNSAVNNIIHISGADFSTNQTTGGDYGVALGLSSTVKNNTIDGLFAGAGVSAGAGSTIADNSIDTSRGQSGYGIIANGDDVKIENNTVRTNASAGIYQQGLYSGIIVNLNNITSVSGVGILLQKSSKTKYPSDITVTNNRIDTSNQYIINAADADKDSYIIQNNTGSGRILTPAGEVDPTEPDFVYNGTVWNITPDDYHSFIDSDGNFMEIIKDGDILNFIGEFDAKVVLVTSSVKITGASPKFTNSTFVVTTDSVWIENMTIINENSPRLNSWGIFIVDTKNIRIQNNNISVTDPNAAYAIYIYQSSKVYAEDNTLYSHGDGLTYTLLSLGVENSEFKNNNVTCIGTSQLHQFEDAKSIDGNTSEVCIGQCLGDILPEHCLDGTNVIPEIYRTYGILMIKSSKNVLADNKVYVSSLIAEKLAVNSTNSLVGIDFYYDCDDNNITSNTVEIEGNDNYLYGMGVLAASTGQFASTTARNNIFTKNNITVTGYNVVEGFIAGQSSQNNTFGENNLYLNSQRTVYGITLESSDKTKISKNTIEITSAIGYGVEAYSSDSNNITDNTFNLKGSVTSAIAGVDTSNNRITNNAINSNGSGKALDFQMRDVLNADNSGIYLEGNSNRNLIDSNIITTNKGYPVDLTSAKSNTVTNNYLLGEKGKGDSGVNATKDNTVRDNYGYSFDNVSVQNVNVRYLNRAVLTVNCDVNGAEAGFTLNGKSVGNATVSAGKASITVQLDGSYPVGEYNFTVTLTKDSYLTAVFSAKLNVARAPILVNVTPVSVKPGTTAPFTAVISDAFGNRIANAAVRFTRNTTFIGNAVSDGNGVAVLESKVPLTLEGAFAIIANVSECANYLAGTGQACLSLSSKIYTKITSDNLTTYYGKGLRLYATLTDLDGNPLASQTVKLTINGVTSSRVTDSEGKVSTATKLVAGKYPVTFEFEGNGSYLKSEANVTLTVLPAIQANDLDKMYRNDSRFNVLIMENGKPLANENISLNINGVIYYRTTNAVGTAGMAINLNPGKYIVTVERLSTGERKSSTITVHSLFEDNTDLVKYYRNASKYSVKVLGKDGKVVGKGVDVTFNINGVFYTRQTDENGVASININLIPNNYIITAEYQGLKTSNNIKILPVLQANDLVKKYGDSGRFTVKVLNGQGNPLANATVTFNINGVFYTRTSDVDGIAGLNINLQAGKYIITSTYNGGNIANTVTVTS